MEGRWLSTTWASFGPYLDPFPLSAMVLILADVWGLLSAGTGSGGASQGLSRLSPACWDILR
jgi:hypothetical protein